MIIYTGVEVRKQTAQGTTTTRSARIDAAIGLAGRKS